MARPAANTLHLTTARFWRLLWNPSPGRLGYALRMACACTVVILVCEIWQVPDAAVPALVTLALWQKDRVTNAIAGIAVNLLFAVVIFLMFGLVHLTLDHPLALVSAVALLSLLFFFLGSASKLKPVSYMLALVVIYAMIVIDQAPIGEIATRALLYADLFILVPGACMVFLGALICPSPKTLLTQDIAARLRISAQLLAAPSTILQEQAEDLLREGAGSMTKYLKLSKLEKLWSQKDLSCLHCALYNSIGVLTLCLATSRTPPPAQEPSEIIQTLNSMAHIFEQGGYPEDIDVFSFHNISNQDHDISILLSNFSNPDFEADITTIESAQKEKTGFFFPDAFTNPEHVRFAVKGTASVMLSYTLFKMLAWQGIHTCVITCFIVALPTMGEMISKLTLRISGALIGGALGIGSIILCMPHLQNSAAFLALMAVGSFIASWVKTGDDRIAYAGLQIGLAFFLSDLKGYGPTTDMTTARDRIIGILIGNFITYTVFTTFWPSSSYSKILSPLKKVFENIKKLHNAPTPMQALVYLATTQTNLGVTERTLELASLEPLHMRAAMPELAHYQQQTQNAAQLTEHFLLPSQNPYTHLETHG
ncbi:FUSC family protein [Acetobacter orientalis]|uniref:Fusaric acid resistance protein n=2 Tax=Acetobacter orientalis TaxID=146474 RepID=A0A0D6NID4_9PROT|nr:FUSC family protein [Acetobacter orientalis]GAN65358.1 fusaric acid resistance protein [Acetobacter orientalis]GEL62190.1 hypothetical protein AOR02nite_20320 [Acetobacter orientalis]